ncbi:unnamed protein product [Acanthosepion pharaonis]|uniref:Uncharacterized protein n=1 Tax=Acanthosepion pharaonis TaxID=158019 RepID=A0A812CWI3_ACAPH|nr:unnamed protein product [Sepia pharaonis]
MKRAEACEKKVFFNQKLQPRLSAIASNGIAFTFLRLLRQLRPLLSNPSNYGPLIVSRAICLSFCRLYCLSACQRIYCSWSTNTICIHMRLSPAFNPTPRIFHLSLSLSQSLSLSLSLSVTLSSSSSSPMSLSVSIYIHDFPVFFFMADQFRLGVEPNS